MQILAKKLAKLLMPMFLSFWIPTPILPHASFAQTPPEIIPIVKKGNPNPIL
jgi:hypothetical protein